MTTLHLLALAGYFLILAEYIAMRHRVICAESDARMALRFDNELVDAIVLSGPEAWDEAYASERLYWNRGMK